jgi:hypothetical protein
MLLTNTAFVFFHGWGATQEYWENLLEVLRDKISLKDEDFFLNELGYFNDLKKTEPEELINFVKNKKNEGKRVIGIGHSIGFPKMLEFSQNYSVDLDFYLGLQTFINYLGKKTNNLFIENYFQTVENFIRHPIGFLEGFFQALKVDWKHLALTNINYPLLLSDMKLLNNKFTSLIPMLEHINYKIFASLDDMIVSKESVLENFPPEKVLFCNLEVGHIMGVLHPEWVVDELRKL